MHGGRHRYRAGALGDHLLFFDQRQDGRGDLVLGDQGDVVHIFVHQFKGVDPRLLDSDAVGNGGHAGQALDLSRLYRIVHAGRACRLDAVDLGTGIHGLDGAGDARDQTAAANGHDDGIHIVQLVEDLQTDGALAGDHVLVVKGVDKGVAPLVPDL